MEKYPPIEINGYFNSRDDQKPWKPLPPHIRLKSVSFWFPSFPNLILYDGL